MKTDNRSRSSVGFEVAEPEQLESIRRELSEEFALRVDAPRERVRSHLDTFDWRLFRRGLRLSWISGPRAELAFGAVTSEGASSAKGFARLSAAPVFAGDLDGIPSLGKAAKVVGVRRLLPVVHVDLDEVRANVLDAESKTVARLYFCSRRARSADPGGATAPLPSRVEVRGVRGYDEDRAVAAMLEKLLGEPTAHVDELEEAMRALGEPAGQNPSQLVLDIAPGTPSARAGRKALEALFEIVLANEAGTRAALDPEFLHDFRVAVRKTRSILRELKAVFPEAVLEHYGGEFRWLGRVTNRARDLDVFEGSLLVAAKKSERRALAPLVEHLEAERIGEQERLVEALDSARFRKLEENWIEFLETESSNGVYREIAFQPIETIMGLRIRKRYRKLSRLGKRGVDHLRDEDLHAIRIQGKRLRYSMQVFESLFDGPGFRSAVGHLKALQSLLGDFNDLHVHEMLLLETASRLVDAGAEEQLLESAASVAARMGKRRKALRKDLRALLERFAMKDVARVFDDIGAGGAGR